MKNRDSWLQSITTQIRFYNASLPRYRNDNEFDWNWYYHSTKKGRFYEALRYAKRIFINNNSFNVPDWFSSNFEKIWNTRTLLEDNESRIKFDSYLVLKAVGPQKFCYPRPYFEDIFTVTSRHVFDHAELSNLYSGFLLNKFKGIFELNGSIVETDLITTDIQLNLINTHRQYLIERDGQKLYPTAGEVAFDCGSCVGEFTKIFASLVGLDGTVVAFDPVPLHSKYLAEQFVDQDTFSIVKPIIAAVGDRNVHFHGTIKDVKDISPGGLCVTDFDMVTIDSFLENSDVKRVDYIKMDIEGAELDALRGAGDALSSFSPKLAISIYHKISDLWEIPSYIKECNPNYKLYFDHHNPIEWEAVLYAHPKR